LYKLYPPTIKETPDAAKIAKEHLKAMGRLSNHEIILCFTLVLLLVLWGLGNKIGVSAITAAIVGISILMVTGVLNWKTLLKEQTAWETLIWFSILLVMAKELSALGFMGWFSNIIGAKFTFLNWKLAFPALALFYFYTHYLFASSTAHVSAMFLPIFLIAIGTGTPPMLAALVLMYFSNLFGGLTHYSTTPAPLLFGVGYVDIKSWWQAGFIMSVINITVWVVVGGLWWKTLGLW
jgi:DASS family divalent anion:Na+ symporter